MIDHSIQMVVDDLVDAWNRHDWDAFSRLFMVDADYVTGTGIRLAGRRRIHEELSTRAHDPVMSDHVFLVTQSVKAVGQDAAVVLAQWRLSDTRSGLLTIVMQRAEETWHIVALQNTDTTS